ncbi:DUF3267 domain-containing protein [Mammaliicoccus stepanovicii]|uniref:Membrane protein n=1 Tax=Mammaliicoccus stepanovicii TaxID=643214 RepID=A0A239YWD3_9STAP|nr:DUF3267 domain-containing protein [Mammaliicoccus stepanovicii]PNZ75342.1 DUF3267 domain-containing protein [Mammaliicoccus stepanovicii]GGI40609.1 hypothetical protein GCM10010896_09230 [Mammaliicoccus stepanovicii]SNV63050.1 membrane protein [Mammaliicoccus stepanovicii]
MFLCSKSINIQSRYGLQRIVLISTLVSFLTFIVTYEIYNYLQLQPLKDDKFILFLFVLCLIYPIHKLLHLIVLIYYRKSFIINKTTKARRALPLYNIRVDKPVNKIVFCVALVCPFVVITTLSLLLINIIPQYVHYILFIMSINIGISIIDLLYLKIILFTKRGTYIEERKNGIELLTKCSLDAKH